VDVEAMEVSAFLQSTRNYSNGNGNENVLRERHNNVNGKIQCTDEKPSSILGTVVRTGQRRVSFQMTDRYHDDDKVEENSIDSRFDIVDVEVAVVGAWIVVLCPKQHNQKNGLGCQIRPLIHSQCSSVAFKKVMKSSISAISVVGVNLNAFTVR
jgi:hypothetical protein